MYSPDGRLAFHRSGSQVYDGPRWAYLIKDNVVYADDGVAQYHIDGVWWYSYSGEACYYQEREIKGDENPQGTDRQRI